MRRGVLFSLYIVNWVGVEEFRKAFGETVAIMYTNFGSANGLVFFGEENSDLDRNRRSYE